MDTQKSHKINSTLGPIELAKRFSHVRSRDVCGTAAVALGLMAHIPVEKLRRRMQRFGIRNVDSYVSKLSNQSKRLKAVTANPVRIHSSIPEDIKRLLPKISDGDEDAMIAGLALLLETPTNEVLWLLHDPDSFFEEYGGPGSKRKTKADFCCEMSKYYGRRMALGQRLFMANGTVPEFAKHAGLLDDVREKLDENDEVFRCKVYKRSEFGRCMAEQGELAAHIFTMCTLCELGHIGDGAPTLRDAVMAVGIETYPRNLRRAIDAAESLMQEWIWSPAQLDELQMGMPLLPNRDKLQSVLRYLEDEPIRTEEIQRTLGNIA